MADDDQRLRAVDEHGRKTYGEKKWDSSLHRLKQVTGGFSREVMNEIVKDPNAAANIVLAGEDARLRLLQQAQDCRNGDAQLAAELESEYTALREEQRQAWRKAHGRR